MEYVVRVEVSGRGGCIVVCLDVGELQNDGREGERGGECKGTRS